MRTMVNASGKKKLHTLFTSNTYCNFTNFSETYKTEYNVNNYIFYIFTNVGYDEQNIP